MTHEIPEVIQTFTFKENAAVLIIGVIAGAIPALQPVLLGNIALTGQITLSQIGETATAEALGMAFAASVAGVRMRLDRLRVTALAAVLVFFAVNLLSTQCAGYAMVAIRLVGGLCSGVLLTLWVGLLARVMLPARLIAIYVTLQGALVLALSNIFSALLVARWGAAAGYACLGVLSLAMVPLVFAIPRHFAPLGTTGSRILPSKRGVVGLVAVGLQLAAIMSLWVYVLPLGRDAGLSESAVGFVISVALGSQIATGLIAAVLAKRFKAAPAILASIAASLAGLLILAFAGTLAPFLAGVVLVAVFWVFAPAFMMPYLIEIDPSRGAAVQILTAQLLGISAGPLLASLAVGNHAPQAAILVSGILYLAAAGLVLATVSTRRRTLRAAGTATRQ